MMTRAEVRSGYPKTKVEELPGTCEACGQGYENQSEHLQENPDRLHMRVALAELAHQKNVSWWLTGVAAGADMGSEPVKPRVNPARPKSTGPRTYLQGMRHYVYRYFDADGNALYVGCTKDVEERYKGHLSMGPSWISKVHRTKVTVHQNRSDARQVEKDEIRRLEPSHNAEVNFMDLTAWDQAKFLNRARLMGMDEKNRPSPKSGAGQLQSAYQRKFGRDLHLDVTQPVLALA